MNIEIDDNNLENDNSKIDINNQNNETFDNSMADIVNNLGSLPGSFKDPLSAVRKESYDNKDPY